MAPRPGTQTHQGALASARTGDLTSPEVCSALRATASSPELVDVLVALDGRTDAPGARAVLDELLQRAGPDRGVEALSRLLYGLAPRSADLWARWAAGLPADLAPRVCEAAVEGQRAAFVLEAAAFGGARHLLVRLLQHDLPPDVAVEAMGHLLRPPDDEGVVAVAGYLERQLVTRAGLPDVDGRLAVNPLSWLVGLGIEDDLVVGVLTRMDPEAIWAGWGRFVRHGDALDRWPSWVNALPTATGLALCDAALASGHSEFLVQVLASGASEALLSGLLHRDLPADADVEVLVRLLARPDPERLGMAQAYLERNDGQALIFLLRLDARVPASTIDRLEAALASDHELLRRLAEAPAAVLPALVVRARRELERTEGGPILKAAPGHLALRSRLVRELADTGSPRLVPLAAGIEELQGILLEAYVAAGCLAGLQALASQGDDDGVVLQAIAYLGALGDGGTHRWLNDLLSGWFIGRDVRRAAQEALAQVSKRLGAGGVALADAGGELSTPDVP